MEHAAWVGSDPHDKITYDEAGVAALFVTLCLEAYRERPKCMIIDLDAAHDPTKASRKADISTAFTTANAELRISDKDATDGPNEEVARIITQVRDRRPEVEIILRPGSGFAREVDGVVRGHRR